MKEMRSKRSLDPSAILLSESVLFHSQACSYTKLRHSAFLMTN